MKNLNFKKIQVCGVLLASSIVLTSCQKKEEQAVMDNTLVSETSVEESFSAATDEIVEDLESLDSLEDEEQWNDTTLDVTAEEKKEMLELKDLLEEELQADLSQATIDVYDLRIIDNKINGEVGYSLGVVKSSSISDKTFVVTLGEERNVYVYRDGDHYNINYIMKLEEVVAPVDFHYNYSKEDIDALLSKIQDAEFLAPCTSYSKDGELTDTQHIAANGVFICNGFSHLYPILKTSTRPKLYVRLDVSSATMEYYGLQSSELAEDDLTDYITCVSSMYGNYYEYAFESYEGTFDENPLIPLNTWLSDNGLGECAENEYSLDNLLTIENAIQNSLSNSYSTITTEDALLLDPALSVTKNEYEEMVRRKDILIEQLKRNLKSYVSIDNVFVIDNAIRGKEGYSIGILRNSHISDKGLIVTYGEEENVYVYRDGDQYNTKYIMKLADVVQPQDYAFGYTDAGLNKMIEKINDYSGPLVSCATYSDVFTDDEDIASSCIYICDSFNDLYPTAPMSTKSKVYIRISNNSDTEDALHISFSGLSDWRIRGVYDDSPRRWDYHDCMWVNFTLERYYHYSYGDGGEIDYTGEFSQNPLVPINDWLLANGYREYIQPSYSVEALRDIEEVMKAQVDFSKQYPK